MSGADDKRTVGGRRRKAITGTVPALRKPKPVKSIGRNAALIYCPDCGRKRTVCTCS